ncbi:MAG: class III extradiol ring-cleavage dioxygenase [Sterolibacterium sp.]
MALNQNLPSLFVPHGAPTFALHPGATGTALTRTACSLPLPQAIIVVSAHWDTEHVIVGMAEKPATIHDFRGFASELYSIQYPASGSKAAGTHILDRLRAAGIAASGDDQRGLDHGAWIPLRLMYPNADVPVIPLSIQSHLGTSHHLALGRALAPLAAEGFLILASGNLTHSLKDYQYASLHDGTTPGYVREFADWIWQRIESNDTASLLAYRELAPDAARAHPSEDHLLPLFVALGAAGNQYQAERFHTGVEDYVLAMDAFMFHYPFTDRHE